MDVGIQMIFSTYGWPGMSDREAWQQEIRLARLADAAVAHGYELPPLHGLPVGIKDLQETEGLCTTFGSIIFRDNIPTTDERLVAALRQAATPTMTLRKIAFGENVKNAVATDGQQAVYWDDARTTLFFGDVAGRNRRVVLQIKPQQTPRVTVSHDFSMALLYFPDAAEQSHWAVIKTDGTGYRELPNLPAGAILAS